MRTNVATSYSAQTHEGGVASPHQKPAEELERAVATCLLFENTFYEGGLAIASRIERLCEQVPSERIATLAVRAREDWKLRHVPLFLCRQLARRGGRIVSETLERVIRRPDEMAEFLAIYWKDNGKRTLSAQMKRGLALAFGKFSEHQLSKWNRDGAVKLRDVLFLCHAKPKDDAQAATWKSLIDGTLPTADTWETALSAGADKKATWERLIREDALGQMATLMNLRNMMEAGVEDGLVRVAIAKGGGVALPFRFVAAAKACPMYANELSDAMIAAIPPTKLSGDTIVLVDVSGSMEDMLSAKGTICRMEAAGALAVLIREIGRARVFTFSNGIAEIAPYRGLPLVEGVIRSQPHAGTMLAEAVAALPTWGDRLVVVTDEQAHDGLPPSRWKNAYVVNVAPYAPSLPATQGGYVRLSGWSERLVDWIVASEARSDA